MFTHNETGTDAICKFIGVDSGSPFGTAIYGVVWLSAICTYGTGLGMFGVGMEYLFPALAVPSLSLLLFYGALFMIGIW